MLTRLQKIQNRAARIITGSDFYASASPLLENLGWKTVRELYKNDLMITVFKARHDKTPGYLKELLCPLLEKQNRFVLRNTFTDYNLPDVSTNISQEKKMKYVLTNSGVGILEYKLVNIVFRIIQVCRFQKCCLPLRNIQGSYSRGYFIFFSYMFPLYMKNHQS